ncbi:MAG: reactive intermediate/imine deaminase [Anaerolineae bacterium]|nr:reactive intermediate/imine deaminase [Anaerolineae bacterium]
MRDVIKTSDAPKAIGPYSQGIRIGNLVYTAGQAAVDPATGRLIEGDIKAQTEQTMKNLDAILRAAGTSLQRAVKANVYLHNIADFAAMNEVYARWIDPEKPPARTTVGGLDLPLGALVEIEVVADASEGS